MAFSPLANASDRESPPGRGPAPAQSAARAGGESWEQWWAELRDEPALAEAFDERDRIFPADWRSGLQSPDLEFHRAALRAAGFTEVAVVWQDLEERVLLALR